MLRFCSQASLSFSSTFYVAPFVQSWHWNKHTIIRYSYEIRKIFYVTFCFVKVLLHSSLHLTFRAALWHVLCGNLGGRGPDKEGGAFPRLYFLPSLAVFSLLSSTCRLIGLFSGLEFWSPLWHLIVKGSKLILGCCGKQSGRSSKSWPQSYHVT